MLHISYTSKRGRRRVSAVIEKILQYRTSNGRVPFREWLLSLRDTNARAVIRARMDRLKLGNFGDYRVVGEGIFELRFHLGPGYRVYFGLDRAKIVILLSGGEKSRQQDDIRTAEDFWKDYLRRRP